MCQRILNITILSLNDIFIVCYHRDINRKRCGYTKINTTDDDRYTLKILLLKNYFYFPN